ncbi:PilZ domain-containing protein [Candidatus Pelagadaptatus aseana]|uniref:PilZ domain-containing protein n=1 Tax=Candidatus Pelagadaptatus aseana TaxID=3120508 RepID=UPI003C702896
MEQRRAPRFNTELNAELSTHENSLGDCVICNISRSGLQIECSMTQAAQLIPNQGGPPRIPDIQLTLSFSVPTSARDKTLIRVTCDLIYVRRVTREKHQLGCQFREFHDDCNEHLEDFLRHFATSQPKSV